MLLCGTHNIWFKLSQEKNHGITESWLWAYLDVPKHVGEPESDGSGCGRGGVKTRDFLRFKTGRRSRKSPQNQVWWLPDCLSKITSGARSPKCLEQQKREFLTNAQSRFAMVVLDSVRSPPLLAIHCPCICIFLEATHEAGQGPLKGAVSAQKYFQWSMTETREFLAGTQEKSIYPIWTFTYCLPPIFGYA